MADPENEMDRTSKFAASGLRQPSAQARPKSTARVDSGAIGHAFLEKMAPPRCRPVQAQDAGVSPTSRMSVSTGSQDTKPAAKRVTFVAETNTFSPRGSMPSTPSSITHPTERDSPQVPPTSTFPAALDFLQSPPPAAVKDVLFDLTPTKYATEPGQTMRKTAKIYHGNAILPAISKLKLCTPSMKLQLKNTDGNITCTISGFPASCLPDDAVETQVEANRKTLKQEMLGMSMDTKVASQMGRRVAHLKEANGNTAIVVSRLVEIMINLFDYEDVLARIGVDKDGLTWISLNGLRWKDWKAFSGKAADAFKKAFTANGKRTAAEEEYFAKMAPIEGLDEALKDALGSDYGPLDTHIDDMPVTTGSINDISGRKTLVPSSRKNRQHLQQAADEVSTKKYRCDSPLQVDQDMPDAPTSTSTKAILEPCLSIHSPVLDPTDHPTSPLHSSSLRLGDLRKARTTGEWSTISTTSLRGFLAQHGRPLHSNGSNTELIETVTRTFDRKFRVKRNDEEDVVLWEQDGTAATSPIASLEDLKVACMTGNWVHISAVSMRKFLNSNGELQEWDASKEEMVLDVEDLVSRGVVTTVEMRRNEEEGNSIEEGEVVDTMAGGEEVEQKRPKVMLRLKNPDFVKTA